LSLSEAVANLSIFNGQDFVKYVIIRQERRQQARIEPASYGENLFGPRKNLAGSQKMGHYYFQAKI